MAGKKTGKRLLTWVLVLVMALSLLPLNVLAANRLETDSSSGMNFDKRADSNGDGTYTITMTAQATGKEVQTTTVKPMDIVLVLDVSGSMDDPIPARFEKIDANDVTKSGTYYVYAKHSFGLISWHSYDKVKWCDRCNSFTHNCFDFIGHNKGQKYDPTKDQFYTKIAEIDKINALKTAVNGFIDQVAKKSADSSIAVVSFASEAANVSGGLLPVKTDAEMLKAAVNGLNAYGATRADLGMQEAACILDNGINSKKVVVMFTDGEPTSGNKFEKDVANATISAAKGMKDKGTEVFTVGVFDSDPDDKTYDYMNYVSSNYPNATSMNSGGKGSDERYYVTADSADSLSKVFEGISQTITKPEPDNAALDEKTVITDTLSDHFMFATGTADGDVKVYAGQRELINGKDITVNLNPTTKTVTVTGYDFSEHYTNSNDPEELVIEIKVKPSGDGYTSANIPTNDDDRIHAARVEVEVASEDGTGTKTKVVTSHPTATVKGYSVEYVIGDNVSWPNNGNGPAKLYYPQRAVVPVTSSEPTREGFKFNGWTPSTDNNAVEDPTISEGKFTMPAANVTLTAQWTANTDTKYTVKHYQQNLNDDDYTLADTESDKTGTTGELTNATAKNYEGFTAKSFDQQTIVADGSTVVDIYYDRNTYSVTYTDGVNNETIFADEVHQGVKYGADVPAYNNGTDPSRKNYTFAGWDPAVPDTMPANSLKFTAKWEKNPVGDGTFDFNDVDHDGKNTPAITKTVKGNVGKNFKETFEVTVKGTDAKSKDTMSAPDYTGKAEVIASKSLKDVPFLFKPEAMANAVVPYGKLRFTEAGTYTYTVQEIPGGTSRMSYDTTEYTLTIEVVLDEDANTYQVESWQFTAGNWESPAALNIVNTYRTYHPSTPSKPTLNTGDHYAYVMGYPDGTVRPNGSITRAEVSAILFRLLSDKTRDEYFTTESSFTDVRAGAWYNNSIATIEKAGVIVDTAKGGAFRPNEAITRAELAAMLAQFSDAKPVKGVKFSDVSAEHWAYEAIAIAAKMGWIEGYPDGTFRPDATITRAEMMTLVNRALERVPSDEDHLLSKRVMLTFPDCKSGDWFYIAVQEATNSHTYERAATEKNGDEQWIALRANRDWTQLEK